MASAGTAAVLACLLWALTAPPAAAAPGNPSDGEIARAAAAQDAAASEIGRIAGMVAAADTELQRVTALAQSAADAHLVAQAQLEQAQTAATAAAAELVAAGAAVDMAQADVAVLGRQSYIRGTTLSGLATLLDADGPAEVLQQAATLEFLGVQRTETLDQLELARVDQANADSAARAALTEVNEAEQTAALARAAAETQLDASQAEYDAVAAEKVAYEQQLQEAQIELLELQGARDAYQAWQQEQSARAAAEATEAAAAAEAAAVAAAAAREAETHADAPTPPSPTPVRGGGGVAPTSGRFTTCYEMRWGTMHYGIDIAAPIGTPIYSPMAGRVLRAGPASGFGLAVYIQHDDGSVTVYGHINDFFVSAGQRVSAGQQVAEVGNRGQSTGPHLHFEVHADGLYQGRTNPVPWLAARGVSMGGRCR